MATLDESEAIPSARTSPSPDPPYGDPKSRPPSHGMNLVAPLADLVPLFRGCSFFAVSRPTDLR
ncbi:hypothetical protein Cni_G17167 [Canna indica]|uniref:Uncharacterized protein n=1 Tax=Canna indica TaxID=4628 RepID=A0AAQ3QEU8_9LILI|nr:hypothetical protein Cni_G17167 [Canna indica]